MVNGKRPDQAEAHETDPSSPTYDRLPGRWAWLARLCDEAYGLPRHLSQHSGGMIVSTRPLIDCCPVLPAAMEGRQLCQWDKDSCADAGFLKIDLLGLGMLSRGRALRGGDRAGARGARGPLADPVRRRRDLRRDPGRRHDGRLPDRVAGADGVAAADAAAVAGGPDDPGRDRAPGPDPRRRGQPVHLAPADPAREPGLRRALRARVAASRCSRTRSARSSSRTR